ncbi:MAG: ScyD/ScyE family protein [Chitinophagaceae bacterium]
MKRFFNGNAGNRYAVSLTSLVFSFLLILASCKKADPPEPVLRITTLASGLLAPIGVEVDKKGRVWVAEGGTTKNDGKVTMITPDGKKYTAINNLPSIINEGGEAEGPAHILFADGLLYILGANGKMYKADVSQFNPGDAAKPASMLGVEDIGAFVLAHKFVRNSHMTHLYNLTVGPNGAIYIADAAANAILRRDKTGVMSVLAEIPWIPNPLPVGGPMVESVPTGIYYDGQNFLVTTLLGFPFPVGKALIYKVTPEGVVTPYQSGFTSLVDIAEGGVKGRLVLQHAVFGLATGFQPNTGKLVWANGSMATTLADGLNQPAGLKQAGPHTWYVTSVADGTILKVEY